MNLNSGSTINGLEILHLGNHDPNSDVHGLYALENPYLTLYKSDGVRNWGKVVHVRYDTTIKNVEIMLDIDIVNITSNTHSKVLCSFNKKDGEVSSRNVSIFRYGNTNKITVQEEKDTSVTNNNAICFYVNVNTTDRVYAKVNKYIQIEDEENKSKESRVYFSKATSPAYLPVDNVTMFTVMEDVNITKNKEIIRFKTQQTIAQSSAIDIYNKTGMNKKNYRITFKSAFTQKTVTSIEKATIRFFRNDVNMYQQTIRLDNLDTNIHDIFQVFSFEEGDSFKIVITNNGTETITTVPSRMILIIEEM